MMLPRYIATNSPVNDAATIATNPPVNDAATIATNPPVNDAATIAFANVKDVPFGLGFWSSSLPCSQQLLGTHATLASLHVEEKKSCKK